MKSGYCTGLISALWVNGTSVTGNQPSPRSLVSRKPRKPPPSATRWIKVAATVIAGVVLVFVGLLLFLILSEGSDIGRPRTESAVLVAANERLLQMVQWTIATVLVLGGAFIGLNWYQSEIRYREDKGEVDRTLEEVRELVDGLEARFKVLENYAYSSLVASAMPEMRLQARIACRPLSPSPGYYGQLFQSIQGEPGEVRIWKHAALSLMIDAGIQLKANGELSAVDEQAFKAVYKDAAEFDANEAAKIVQLLLISEASTDGEEPK